MNSTTIIQWLAGGTDVAIVFGLVSKTLWSKECEWLEFLQEGRERGVTEAQVLSLIEIYRPSTLFGIVTQNLVRFLPTLPS
jgi:hypothetical protein